MGHSREEGIATVRSFLESLEKNPLRTNDPNRPLTEGLAVTAMTGSMYNTTRWPQLTQRSPPRGRRATAPPCSRSPT